MAARFVVPEESKKHARPRRALPGSASPMTEAAAKRTFAKIQHAPDACPT